MVQKSDPTPQPCIHLPNHPALTLTAHGTRSNPEIITLEVLLFFYLWLISCIESEDLISFPTHVICTNVHNNLWLLMLSLGNVLQSLRDTLYPERQQTILECHLQPHNLPSVPLTNGSHITIAPPDFTHPHCAFDPNLVT